MSKISGGGNYGYEAITSMMDLVSSNRIVLFTAGNEMYLFDNLSSPFWTNKLPYGIS